jgi:hypothetical protein
MERSMGADDGDWEEKWHSQRCVPGEGWGDPSEIMQSLNKDQQVQARPRTHKYLW